VVIRVIRVFRVIRVIRVIRVRLAGSGQKFVSGPQDGVFTLFGPKNYALQPIVSKNISVEKP
jgi:hypothetical protein